jgi:hypothetical protein
MPTCRCVFECIVEQNQQQLLEAILVADDRDRL